MSRNVVIYQKLNRIVGWMKVTHQIVISYGHCGGGICSESEKLCKITLLIRNVINVVYGDDGTRTQNQECENFIETICQ